MLWEKKTRKKRQNLGCACKQSGRGCGACLAKVEVVVQKPESCSPLYFIPAQERLCWVLRVDSPLFYPHYSFIYEYNKCMVPLLDLLVYIFLKRMFFPLSLYHSLSPNPEKTVAMQMRMIYATTFLGGKISIHYEYYEDRKTRREVFRMKVICYLLFTKCKWNCSYITIPFVLIRVMIYMFNKFNDLIIQW